MDSFIYGQDPTERIVGLEPGARELILFIEQPDGTVERKVRPLTWWALSNEQHNSQWAELRGTSYFKYKKTFRCKDEMIDEKNERGDDIFVCWEPKEAAMLTSGLTYFKGMKPRDVSVLSFDIESTSLDHGAHSKVLLISNTFRRSDYVERKLFKYSDYPSAKEFFDAHSAWVREKDPAVITGHNIFMYDLPYMVHCAAQAGTKLTWGRNGKPLYMPQKDSKYRRDGSQDYFYRNARIFGREICDTLFLSYKYDFSRKYESYGLKNIIKHEGLERKDRTHYDASKIARNYQIPEEWAKICAYAEHDADDALAIFDLMVPAYFYLNQSVPKPFQAVINGASGAWLNSFLVRSYLQEGHSIPKTTDAAAFEGAISIGNPGVYQNVFKVDVASLYPSIMLGWELYDRAKDPEAHFYKMVSFFTKQRLEHKRLAKETGDRHYSDLEQAEKIFINSAYGLLGAPGLNFNSPTNGAEVTRIGRDILTRAIEWAALNELVLVNADTDSISISQATPWTAEQKEAVLKALNAFEPGKIRWEDDGVYDAVLVARAKNYALLRDGKIKIKGSALKATTKEKALRRFIDEMISTLLSGAGSQELVALYNKYALEALHLTDITQWCSKSTITDAVLSSDRTQEAKKRAALDGSTYTMGDKVWLYFTKDGSLKLAEHWASDHDPLRLLKKLHDTVKVFATVTNVKDFPNYTLKRSGPLLQSLMNSSI